VISTATLSKIRCDVDRHTLRARNGIKHVSGASFVRVGQTQAGSSGGQDAVRLHRYESSGRSVSPPVLLIPSLINRSYIFDLHPGNSFVEYLLAAGIDVFLVDWGGAGRGRRQHARDVCRWLSAGSRRRRQRGGRSPGHHDGRLLHGWSPAAPVCGRPLPAEGSQPDPVGQPIDFAEMGLLVAMVREGRLEVDDILDKDGNVPGDVIRRVIQLRRPTGGLVTYANLLENLWNDAFMAGYQAMSRWVRESVPIPGALARQLIEHLVRRNELAGARMELGGRVVDLADVSAPCLVVVAEDDDMVPLACASPLAGLLTGADVDELRLPGGHIALMVGRRAATVTFPDVIDWVRAHSDAPPEEE
jgi:polyhydroxyalkanoate synthase